MPASWSARLAPICDITDKLVREDVVQVGPGRRAGRQGCGQVGPTCKLISEGVAQVGPGRRARRRGRRERGRRLRARRRKVPSRADLAGTFVRDVAGCREALGRRARWAGPSSPARFTAMDRPTPEHSGSSTRVVPGALVLEGSSMPCRAGRGSFWRSARVEVGGGSPRGSVLEPVSGDALPGASPEGAPEEGSGCARLGDRFSTRVADARCASCQ